MATKERAGGRLLRFPRRDTVNLSRRAFMGMAEAVSYTHLTLPTT